jgi:hypothetical protein
MFGLNTHMVTILDVDLRTETEEDKEPVGACDISIHTFVSNNVLSDFHPQLKESFYAADDSPQPDMLDGTMAMPNLKFPTFPRFPWKADLEGYRFIAHTGTGGPSEVRMEDVKINSIKFKMKEKGMVDMGFVIRAHDNPGDIDKLRKLLGLEVQISLVPPDKAKQHELEMAKQERTKALNDHFQGGAAASDSNTQPLDLPEAGDEPDGGNEPAGDPPDDGPSDLE